MEQRFGLTEGQRQAAWKDFYHYSNEAAMEAIDLAGGDLDKETEMSEQIFSKYRARIIKYYSVTEDELGRIVAEGMVKGWKMPLPSYKPIAK